MLKKMNRPLRITPFELMVFFIAVFVSGLLIAYGAITTL